MKSSQSGLCAAALIGVLGLALPVLASNNPLAGAMGNLRWGMRDHDVKSALKSEFADKNKLAGLEASYVEFDGSPSQWDKTPLAEEYTHRNDEAMMTVEDKDGSRNYYFFIGGELWKWVKVYPASAFASRDFSGFSSAIQRRFGKGRMKQGEVNAGSGRAYKFIEYVDRNTRVRAVDKLKQQGGFALVFESMGTVRTLSALRSNSPRRGASARAMTESEPDESSAKQKPAAKRDSGDDSAPSPTTAASNAGKSRSIFAEPGQDDGAKEEANRKPRAQANARKGQARSDDRPKPDKQQRNLDKLLGDDDDDPLLGLP